MLLVIGLILLIVICSLGYYFNLFGCDDGFACIGWIFGTILFIFITIIFACSYLNYLDDRSFSNETYKQFKNQIIVYQQESKINVKNENNSNTITDLKYQQYQDEISQNIRIYTTKVAAYNKSIIEKRILKNNIIFSWIIVAPDDDMKPLTNEVR
jgi:hypothetical protein